ncbi:MAG: [FeFe] hydrogenase H-cluster radical SAM maturase HydG [Oscillospiraceae bacterium]|nr:[FeFe] hydrogenase H-cluster radical SAM maturase HydG [Oscillospiraceae bacterium]
MQETFYANAIERDLAAGASAAQHTFTVQAIIDKGLAGMGLSPFEAAVLLKNKDPQVTQSILDAARQVKQRIYGKRVVIFAPLYINDHCVNNCRYCGYKADNQTLRRVLTQDEIAAEVRVLESMGHKRLALEAGQHPDHAPIEYITESIETIYNTVNDNGVIRRVNVNIAAASEDDYRKLKAANIGTYVLFQETYHPEAYAYYHPDGPKSDFTWHSTAMDRAMSAGIDDIGLGALFGLYDADFEVLGLLHHALHLEKTHGVGPHTISVPRMKAAAGSAEPLYPLDDEHFVKIVAVLRLALPYVGLIASTRESEILRKRLLHAGVSQISAGSRTGVGSYTLDEEALSQFSVSDTRNLDEVVRWLCEDGFIPSFCVDCYREGRTGDLFMNLAKSGKINEYCTPSALKTLVEYSAGYATGDTKAAIAALLERLQSEPEEDVAYKGHCCNSH